MNTPTPQPQEEELTPKQLRGWIEFGCWTALALAPFLYWVNGPAVSTDQFVVRTALVVFAALGAVGLRIYAWMRKNRDRLPTSGTNEKTKIG